MIEIEGAFRLKAGSIHMIIVTRNRPTYPLSGSEVFPSGGQDGVYTYHSRVQVNDSPLGSKDRRHDDAIALFDIYEKLCERFEQDLADERDLLLSRAAAMMMIKYMVEQPPDTECRNDPAQM